MRRITTIPTQNTIIAATSANALSRWRASSQSFSSMARRYRIGQDDFERSRCSLGEAPAIACLRDQRSPRDSSAVRHDLGRGHDRARLRRRPGDPQARGRGARDRDACARPALATARLERDGRRDRLGPVADRSSRGLRLRRPLDRLRPDADPEVRPRGAARRRRADPRLRPRAAAPARAARRRAAGPRRRGSGSSWSAGSTSPSRSPCRSSARSSSPTSPDRWTTPAAISRC